MRVSGGKVQNAGDTGLPTAFKQEQPKEEKTVNQVKKSPNKKVSAKNKKKKKSKIWIVPVAIVAVVALLIVMVVVKKSSGNKNGVSAQDAYNSWSSLVQSGSFDALATANEAGNKGYLYQEISYNNDNPIYAKMKKAVLAKTEYSLPQVEETGLFNKGEKRQGDLNKDNITLARTTLDWSKVPVNRVDIQQAIQAWKVDKLAEDTAKNKASKDSSNTSTSDDKEPSLDDYTHSINSVSYNIDSAEIFAEWAVIITKQATGLRTTKQISKNEMISEGAAGYSASVAEDEYLDKVLFSSDDFINCMNDFQNQLYLMSGGQADENTTKPHRRRPQMVKMPAITGRIRTGILTVRTIVLPREIKTMVIKTLAKTVKMSKTPQRLRKRILRMLTRNVMVCRFMIMIQTSRVFSLRTVLF